LKKNAKLKIKYVSEWLDCGNKNATLYANKRLLENMAEKNMICPVCFNNSVIVNPCFIGKNVQICNSVIGPYVSIGNNSIIKNSVVTNSIIQQNTVISDGVIDNSIIGNNVKYSGKKNELNIGDYSEI